MGGKSTRSERSQDWALNNSGQLAALVLLNTYYCEVPTLRAPEAIWLFSTSVVRNIARFISGSFHYWVFRRMYWWQVGGFFRDAEVRDELVQMDEPKEVARLIHSTPIAESTGNAGDAESASGE